MQLLEIITKISDENQVEIVKIILNDTITIFLRIIFLILLFYFGRKIINFVLKRIENLSKEKVDVEAKQFTNSFLKLAFNILLFLIAMLILGFDKHSIVTMVSAVGLGIGISLKDFLSNLAGGVVIMFTKPFKIGQYITVQGTYGKVCKIEVFSTYINTLDSRKVIIPNNFILTNMVTNQDAYDYRQIKLNVPISYECDHNKALSILENLCKTFPGLEHDRDNFVNIMEYGDSSVNILLLVWTKHDGYYRVRSNLLIEIIKEFNAANIEIPYNKLDVNITK